MRTEVSDNEMQLICHVARIAKNENMLFAVKEVGGGAVELLCYESASMRSERAMFDAEVLLNSECVEAGLRLLLDSFKWSREEPFFAMVDDEKFVLAV